MGRDKMKKGRSISKRIRAMVTSFVLLVVLVAPFNTALNAAEMEFNYAKALQYSIFFYDAICGTELKKITI